MSEAFLRFKKRALLIRTLRSLLFGAAVGLFLFGSLRVAVTLELIAQRIGVTALICVLCAMCVGGAVFLIFGVLFFVF